MLMLSTVFMDLPITFIHLGPGFFFFVCLLCSSLFDEVHGAMQSWEGQPWSSLEGHTVGMPGLQAVILPPFPAFSQGRAPQGPNSLCSVTSGPSALYSILKDWTENKNVVRISLQRLLFLRREWDSFHFYTLFDTRDPNNLPHLKSSYHFSYHRCVNNL